MNKKDLQSFEKKTLVAKINCYFSDQSKKLNQVTLIQIVSKKYRVTHELQLHVFNKGVGIYNSKKRCCMNVKKKFGRIS